MTMRTAFSRETDAHAAVSDLRKQLGGSTPKLLLFFVSSRYSADAIASAVKQHFGDVPSLGCTTAGELVTGKMLDASIVATALDAAQLKDATVALVPDSKSAGKALAALANHVGKEPRDLDPD